MKLNKRWGTWLSKPRKAEPPPPAEPAAAVWDGLDFAALQMLPARRVNGVPACQIRRETGWNGAADLYIRGYDGVVPIGSVITADKGELLVTPSEKEEENERNAEGSREPAGQATDSAATASRSRTSGLDNT